MTALDLHGDFAGPKLKGDLFVEHAGNNQTHDLTLTRGQRLIVLPQFGKLTLLMASDAIAIEGLLNRIQQILVNEWLGQELHGAGFDGFHRHRNIAVSGNEDDWNAHASFFQLSLKLQAIDSRERHVQNKATRRIR